MEALKGGKLKPKSRTAKVSTLYEGNGNGLKPVVPAADEAIKTLPSKRRLSGIEMITAEMLCNTDECTGCVYRQVVEILAARMPGVSELVAALKLLNKV